MSDLYIDSVFKVFRQHDRFIQWLKTYLVVKGSQIGSQVASSDIPSGELAILDEIQDHITKYGV